MLSIPTISLWAIIVLSTLAMSLFYSAKTSYENVNWLRIKNLAIAGDKRAQKAYIYLEKKDCVILSTLFIETIITGLITLSLFFLAQKSFETFALKLIFFLIFFIAIIAIIKTFPYLYAKERAEKTLLLLYPLFGVSIVLFWPLIQLMLYLQRKVSSIIRVETVTVELEEELMTIVTEAQSEGDMNEQEGELIRSAIEFRDLDVKDILTPRVDIVGLSVDSSVSETIDIFKANEYTRLPVYRENMDKIVGILHQKDFFLAINSGLEDIKTIIKPVVFAPSTLKISKLLHLLQSNKTHIAVVVDEFGGTEGIVTMEDILEELVGEIYDEHDDVEIDIQKINDNEYIVDGSTELEEVLTIFDVEDSYETDTVAGWVAEEMDKIPLVGESFSVMSSSGLIEVKVTQADRKRVNQVKIMRKLLDDDLT